MKSFQGPCRHSLMLCRYRPHKVQSDPRASVCCRLAQFLVLHFLFVFIIPSKIESSSNLKYVSYKTIGDVLCTRYQLPTLLRAWSSDDALRFWKKFKKSPSKNWQRIWAFLERLLIIKIYKDHKKERNVSQF